MIKVFCIGYAGGNSNYFHNLINKSNDFVKYIAIEYSGHGKRKNEPLYKTFEEMVIDVSNMINIQIDKSDTIALFGYSMGSLVAFDILSHNLLNIESVIHLFVAAHFPPHISSVENKFSTLSDEEFINRMKQFGTVNEAFLKDKRFWPLFLKPVRNDYRLIESYDFNENKYVISVPITVLYSSNDTDFNIMKEWKLHSHLTVELHEITGNHFFLNENLDLIDKLIKNKLAII